MSQSCSAGAAAGGLGAPGHSPHKEMEQIKTARKQRQSVTVLNSISLLSFFFSLSRHVCPAGADHLLPNTLVTAFK